MVVSRLLENHKTTRKLPAFPHWESHIEWLRWHAQPESEQCLGEWECPFGKRQQASRQEEQLTKATLALVKRIFDQLAKPVALADYWGEPKDSFAEDVQYFKKNLAELLRKFRGKYIALINKKVIDADEDFSALAQRVFDRYGCRDIFMPRVTEKEEVVHIPTPFAGRSSHGEIQL